MIAGFNRKVGLSAISRPLLNCVDGLVREQSKATRCVRLELAGSEKYVFTKRECPRIHLVGQCIRVGIVVHTHI
jgi:hypothetical protein